LRLARHGAKKRPFYRIVAADIRAPRDGRFLEIVGTYDPNHDPFKLRLKQGRVDYWIDQGVQPTNTVRSLLRHAKKNPEQIIFLDGPNAQAPVAPAAAAPVVEEAPAAEATESETEVKED
jgi:small subunit ribosomal protein S16